MAELRWLSHSCFGLVDDEHRVIIDPFLAPDNPAATDGPDDLDPTHILLTHGHGDHLGATVELAKRTGAEVLAITELARWLERQGLENVHDPNLGGTVAFPWGSVKLVQALHTNTVPDGTAIGQPAGLIVGFAGRTIYHLGDTCLFSDLALIGERNGPIDVALVPIGGHYTMDRHDAAYACGLIKAGTVIPCHFNTFPPIETDAAAFKTEVEASSSSRVAVLEVRGSLEL
ncbi:MAG TPA: metal-dependent hydrolase [Solirubrobacterales bacterium]|nr:metal-dependent hydrolase [Solirubrobacterales bacterium]